MKEHTKNIIETLYPMNACLLGEGYDNRLEFIKSLLKLDIIEFPSGTEVGTWTVPDEWIVRDAWVKDPQGNKIADYKVNPLSLVVGSLPYHATVTLDELRKHWHYSDESPNAIPYVFKYYDKDWGFCFAKNSIKKPNNDVLAGIKLDTGKEFYPEMTDKLKDGDYEVFIDTEYKPGTMKIGVHTIPGKSDREILLFAHLDHPFQANDNLSAVACLLSIAKDIKSNNTVKIVFCPETIGSTLYALTQDISKVDFVLAVDICGNKNSVLLQKSFDVDARINNVAHLALQQFGETYRKGAFRNTIGSDESVFNDPLIGIPGIMLSTWDYPEYHTSEDTPDKIDYDQIEKMGKLVLKILEYWDSDFIPVREFKGQLMRSRYGVQTPNQQVNLSWDYLIYNIDGKKYLSQLCTEYGLNYDFVMSIITKIEDDKKIRRVGASQAKLKKTSKKK
jgi:aminopeptidase-like protein